MKRNHSLPSTRTFQAGLLAVLLAASAGISMAQEAAVFRRFTSKDGKSFYAVVQSRTDTAVTFKLKTGKTATQRITELSDPDQQYVRRWTKFKDELVNNAEFSKITVKDLLELRAYQSFEFDIRGNHIYVDTEVGGKPMTLMVDTGCDVSVFHVDACKTASLNVGPMDQEISGIAGKAPAAIVSGVTIKLGDVAVENRKYMASNLTPSGIDGKNVAGILGADFLREMDAVVSYREGRMFLRSAAKGIEAERDKDKAPKELAAEFRRWTKTDGTTFVAALHDKKEKEAAFRFQDKKIAPLPIEKLSEADQDMVNKWSKLRDDLVKNPQFRTLTVKELLELRNYESFSYRLAGNHILVGGSVGATKATFLIDTGAYNGVFDLAFSKKAGLKIGPMDQVIRGIGGTAPAAITEIPSMRMGEALIENRELLSADLYKDAGPLAPRDHDAIFGAEFLRQLDAVINYKEGRIFLKPDQSDKPEAAADAKGAEPSKEAAPSKDAAPSKEKAKDTPKASS